MQTINKLGLIALILAMGAVGYYVISSKKTVEDVKIQKKDDNPCIFNCVVDTDAGKPDKLINCMKTNCGPNACYSYCKDKLSSRDVDCNQCYS